MRAEQHARVWARIAEAMRAATVGVRNTTNVTHQVTVALSRFANAVSCCYREEAEREREPERQFPIMGDQIKSIAWALLTPHEAQAKVNHGQTLARLAERGGLNAWEAICVLKDWKLLGPGAPKQEPDDVAEAMLLALVAERGRQA